MYEENKKLDNAVEAFMRLKGPGSDKYKSVKGKKITYLGSPSVHVKTTAESHVQGMAKYHNHSDRTKHVAVVSHNNKGASRGFFVVHYTIEGQGDTKTCTFETMDENMNHPGGIQIYKNHLYVAMENGSKPQSRVRGYDISPLFQGGQPIPLGFDIPRDGMGAGMVGVTDFIQSEKRNYLIAVGERRHFWFYMAHTTAQDTTPIDRQAFTLRGSSFDIKDATIDPESHIRSIAGGDYHSIGLLTQKSSENDETPFMIGFRYEGNDSKADLFEIQIDWKQDKMIVSGLKLRRSLTLDTTDGTRCRYGAGIDVMDAKTLHIVLTERNYGAKYIKTNLFEPATTAAAAFGGEESDKL